MAKPDPDSARGGLRSPRAQGLRRAPRRFNAHAASRAAPFFSLSPRAYLPAFLVSAQYATTFCRAS